MAASVQAALNALQAGQLSLNQVTKFGNFLPSLVSSSYDLNMIRYNSTSNTFIIVLSYRYNYLLWELRTQGSPKNL